MDNPLKRNLPMRFGVSLAVAILATTSAGAAEVTKETFEAQTVGDIVALCSEPEESDIGKYAVGFCFGWLRGIDQFYDALLADERFDVKPVSCPGREVSPGETRQLFVEWANGADGALEMAALPGLIRAAKELFPCS